MTERKERVILAIETALSPGGVSILREKEVISTRSGEIEQSRSEDLLLIIQELLRANQLAPRDLDVIAVALGPGSYTGIKVGLATAKGLSLGTGANLIGILTFEAMAASASARNGIVRSAIVRGPHTVLYQDFRMDESSRVEPIGEISETEVDGLVNLTNLNQIDSIVLDERLKLFDKSFARHVKVESQPLNLSKYVGLAAANNRFASSHYLEAIYGSKLS